METYEQKVERVAIAFWVALEPSRGEGGRARWLMQLNGYKERYRRAARAALEEEAREIEEDV